MSDLPLTKLHGVLDGNGSAGRKYLDITYGPVPLWKAALQELATLLLGGVPGALGIVLRRWVYRPFFAHFGRKVIIGRHVTFRHACKIRLGDGVVLDDNSVVDAKGEGNDGIRLDNGVYVGRNTIVYCKGGSIHCAEGVSLSADCILFSSNSLDIGAGTTVGSFSYFLSGGEYDPASPVPFREQDGMRTRGPLSIGKDCWFGARVTVLDAAQSIGDRCTFGAGTVVTRPVPTRSVVVGVPGRVVRTLP